ncbi:trypsin-like peptidase domain-containing protein [Antarcticimicrobium luteum]|uniref:Serine protease n=1 Tax=Antarcticimicrobium luteum TaxID=2547397 RepID=A0A4R5VDL2_9RHOB|nr:trypsin-like peptidase domain-containing protein [Antarcticimicrobium luteum]TDK50322.1 serine protease [Antarcticimicrobium luteum]
MEDLTPGPVVAALEHLTGRCRGEVTWITGARIGLWLTTDRRLVCTAEQEEPPQGATLAARLARSGAVFDIEAPEGASLWVNGSPLRQARLRPGDVIEFGEAGPISRIRVYDNQHRPVPTLGEIMGDTLSYLRASRRPLPSRAAHASGDLSRRLLRDTTVLFRGTVLLMLAILTVAVVLQYRTDRRLRAQIESGGIQVDTIAAELAQARRDAIRESDLNALREDLQGRLGSTAERLETLEARSEAARRVIGTARLSVAFIQGGYGLRDTDSGRMLRHVVTPDGVPLLQPGGQPFLSLQGEGPVAEVQFNGTGFALQGVGLLVTNRHVARPWDESPGLRLGASALEPVMTRFIAFFPDRPDPVPLRLLRVSEEADLALLEPEGGEALPPGLPLAEEMAAPGDGVIVMGYPTGLMSLLAQSGAAFVEELQAGGDTDFWTVAAKLAEAGLISPLASRGIVGQATVAAVVYDAETTHGGSGGPVLTLDGAVIAVNSAIMPVFGGSNLGVPVRYVRALLEAREAD